MLSSLPLEALLIFFSSILLSHCLRRFLFYLLKMAFNGSPFLSVLSLPASLCPSRYPSCPPLFVSLTLVFLLLSNVFDQKSLEWRGRTWNLSKKNNHIHINIHLHTYIHICIQGMRQGIYSGRLPPAVNALLTGWD